MHAIKNHLKTVSAVCFSLALLGCASQAPLTSFVQADERPVAAPTSGGYDWSWDVAGDQPVRPIQVFTNGEKTWIQMAPHQVMPAVFVTGVPVSFDISPPYLVIVGAPSKIDLIATNYRAVITRRAPPPPIVQSPRSAPMTTPPDLVRSRITLVPPSEIK